MIFLSAIRVLICYKAVVLNQDKEWRESCPPGDIWKCVETFLVVGSGLLLVSSAKRSGRLVNTLWSKWYHKELSSLRCQQDHFLEPSAYVSLEGNTVIPM